MSIKILSGALDELQEGQIVLRGVIDPTSLNSLLRPAYQRETLPKATIENLMEAFRDGCGRVPDVELAVRGERYGCTDHRGEYTIAGDVYIVDGLQRISAARQCMYGGGHPLVGATIHFGTTEKWERDRFRVLNMRRSRLSPNVLLRNQATECASLRRLYDLCSDDGFVLCQRVSWSQNMRREELLTALTFLRTAMRIHSKYGAGRYVAVSGLWQALPPMMSKVGHSTMIGNVKTFFGMLDSLWGVREILYKDRATHPKSGFLFALADVISNYSDFWRGKNLYIDRDLQKKIGQFPLNEPSIRGLASSAGGSMCVLTRLIVDHINSGKRTKRLVPADPFEGGSRREV